MPTSSIDLDLTEEDLSLRWLFQPMNTLREEINTMSITCQFDPRLGAKFPQLAERGQRLIGSSNMSRDEFIDRIMKLPRLPTEPVQSSPTSSRSSDNCEHSEITERTTPSPVSGTAQVSSGSPVQLWTPNKQKFSVSDIISSMNSTDHSIPTEHEPIKKRARGITETDEEIDVG